jgi:xanthine dehydrogenase molybdenum-binding subunit
MTASSAFKVIGTRPVRPDGVDKVTGRAIYGADVKLPGTLHGKVLRSPHAHARILHIDFSAAAALPGVRAGDHCSRPAGDCRQDRRFGGIGGQSALHEQQRPGARQGALLRPRDCCGRGRQSVHTAEEAVKLIKVQYDLLPPVLDGKQAMAADAPIILDDLRTNELGKRGDLPTNVAEHIQHKRGDLAAGFAQAAVIVERTVHTATVHQGYIEPQNATALWSEDGSVRIWCSTQGAFSIQGQTAEILNLPVSLVTVTPTEIGGGFGGKLTAYLEPLAALLSRKSGHRPVKMTMSRADVLCSTGPTSGSHIHVKMGADRSGKITAAQATLIYEAGAFPGSPVGAGCGVIFGPYKVDHLQIDGYDVIVNRPKSAAYRAPGATNAVFASETVVDELAEKLGIDPLEFRRINGVQEGDRRADGPAFKRIGFMETVQAAIDHPHYRAPLEGPYRGRGVAAGYWGNWGGKSSASASVNADGTINLVEGSPDIGGSRASIAMQLAETLGLPYEQVRPTVVGTDSVGYNDVTAGSRTTFGTGWAVYEVGKALLAEMSKRAAEHWDVAPESVSVHDGIFSHNGDRISFKELAGQLDVPVMASATVHPQGYGAGFAVHIVDVEVDPETGKVQILRYTALQDVGKAIHPSYVEGQLQGGAAQGVGWALNEEYVYDEQGRLLNASLLDYRMPTAPDLPMIDTVLVEVANPGHPYGVRGVGETPIVPPAAALANAIYHATGLRMTELPMSPRRVMEAYWTRG